MRLCVFKAEGNIKLVLLLVVFWNPAGSAGGRPKSAPQAVHGAKKIFWVNVRQHLQDVFIGEGLACCQHPNVSSRCQKTVAEFVQEGTGTGSRQRRKRSRARQHSALRSRVSVIQRSARFAANLLHPPHPPPQTLTSVSAGGRETTRRTAGTVIYINPSNERCSERKRRELINSCFALSLCD